MPSHSIAPTPALVLTPTQAVLRRLDAAAAILAILWMAEALVRTGGGAAITAAIYAWFCLRFAMTSAALVPVLARNWPALAFPAVAMVSVLWSVQPWTSLAAAAQLAFTVVLAVYAGRVFGIAGLAALLLAALTLGNLASVLNLADLWPPSRSWEGGFLGIYTNKNALGQRAALALLCAVHLALVWRGPKRLAAVLAGALSAWLLVLSASATGILLGLAAGAGIGAIALWRARPALRLPLLVALATVAGAGAVAAIGLGFDPWRALLDQFGKSPTLTGRTLLWQIALGHVGQRPVLGLGYMAFWTAPAHAQEVRLIAELYGSTVAAFHNFLLETAVMLGLPGLLSMLLLVGWSAREALRCGAGAERSFALAALALLVVMALLGSSLYRPHEITLFLVVALGAAAAPARGSPAPPGVRTG